MKCYKAKKEKKERTLRQTLKYTLDIIKYINKIYGRNGGKKANQQQISLNMRIKSEIKR